MDPTVHEARFDAPPAMLWSFLATPAGFAAWWAPEDYRVDLHEMDLRDGGKLRYDLVAVTPAQIAYLAPVGRPAAHPSQGTYFDVVPGERLGMRFIINFLDGVRPHPYDIRLALAPDGAGTRLTMTVDPHHDPELTRLAAIATVGQLKKLAAAVATAV